MMTRREENSHAAGIGLEAGAHIMCSALLCRTEKSLFEHYNELAAKLDATQETGGMTWPILSSSLCVSLPHSLYFPLHLKSSSQVSLGPSFQYISASFSNKQRPTIVRMICSIFCRTSPTNCITSRTLSTTPVR